MANDDRVGFIAKTTKTLKANPYSTGFVGLALAVSSGLAVLDAAGVPVVPSFIARADELKRVEADALKRDEAIMKQLKEMSSDSRVLLREFWMKQKQEAEEELATNPNSRTAQKQKREAERAIARIDAKDAEDLRPTTPP